MLQAPRLQVWCNLRWAAAYTTRSAPLFTLLNNRFAFHVHPCSTEAVRALVARAAQACFLLRVLAEHNLVRQGFCCRDAVCLNGL